MVKLYRATGKKVKVSGDHFGNGIRSIWPLAGGRYHNLLAGQYDPPEAVRSRVALGSPYMLL